MFVLGAAVATAQLHVVQKSAKKTPAWVNATEQEYIITSAIAADAETAKNQCMDNVRKYVIDAVAQNVKSASTTNINQETVDNRIVKFLDTYSYTAQTQSANVPFLTGISESKVEASYWEKREDKTTKEVSYQYSIKYPFPSLELKKLVHQFRTTDDEMSAQLDALEEQFTQVESVAQIDKAISDLASLQNYFFDDVRKDKARKLQRSYRQLYGEITLHEVNNRLGCYLFDFQLNGRPVVVNARPVVKSETLSQLRAEPQEDKWAVFYSAETCDPSEENSAKITFKVGDKTLTHTFYIDPRGDEAKVTIVGEMMLTAKTVSDSLLSGITVRVEVSAERDYKLSTLVLHVPGLGMPIVMSDLDKAVAKGSQLLAVEYNDNVEVLERLNRLTTVVQGSVEVKDETGFSRQKEFSVPARANW